MKALGLEKVMRDLRIFRIFEGANDILRLFVALSGIQYAGGHLRELQKAIKNPIGNFGIVMGEVSKRAGHAVGLASGNHLAPHVHNNLVQSAALTCKGVDAFGAAVEAVLIKHGKIMQEVPPLLKKDETADTLALLDSSFGVVHFCKRAVAKGDLENAKDIS